VLWDRHARPLAARVELELIALGYVAELRQVPHQPAPSLSALARASGAVGIAQVRVVPKRVEVWAGHPGSGKKAYRETVRLEQFGEREAALLTVDMVRAALIEVGVERAAPAPPPPPETPIAAPSEPPPNWALSLGAALAGSGGGVSPTVHAKLMVDVQLAGPLSLGVGVTTPGMPGSVEASEGDAAVYISLLGADLDGVLANADHTLGLRFGLGIAAAWIRMVGSAQAPYVSESDDVFCAMPYLRLSGWLALVEQLRLVGELQAGIATPRPVIAFADREVASWGRPALLGALGLGYAF